MRSQVPSQGVSPETKPPEVRPPNGTRGYSPAPGVFVGVMALVFVASLAVGAMVGYIGVRGFDFLPGVSSERPAPSVSRPSPPPPATAPAPTAPSQPDAPARATAPTAPQQVSRPTASGPPPPVAAPQQPKPAAPAVVFRLQVGAFRHRENAEILVRKLYEDGFKADISHVAGLYKVRVGTFTNRKDADLVAKELRAKRYDVFVTK